MNQCSIPGIFKRFLQLTPQWGVPIINPRERLDQRDAKVKSQQVNIRELNNEIKTMKELQEANRADRNTMEHEELADEFDQVVQDLEKSRKNERVLQMKLQENEMKMEEHSKVKAMIDGINQSNLKNLESFEEQIKQRNITIEALRSDIDEKRKRVERAENELNVVVEQKERYRVEAQQASDKGTDRLTKNRLKKHNPSVNKDNKKGYALVDSG